MIVDAISGFMQGVVKPILDKIVPDAAQRLEAEQTISKGIQALNLAQVQLNTVEAGHQSLFVAGWRPYIGWGCGTAFLYSALFEPILRFVATVCFGYSGTYPILDTGLTMEVLVGMLGMASLRSYDKLKGTS